jgi:hypothetical protein
MNGPTATAAAMHLAEGIFHATHVRSRPNYVFAAATASLLN